jgi:hypothetical protein
VHAGLAGAGDDELAAGGVGGAGLGVPVLGDGFEVGRVAGATRAGTVLGCVVAVTAAERALAWVAATSFGTGAIEGALLAAADGGGDARNPQAMNALPASSARPPAAAAIHAVRRTPGGAPTTERVAWLVPPVVEAGG